MKTVIWDFNGTILDDVDISVEIENQMLKERGYRSGYTTEDYRNMFCFPMTDYYDKLGYTFETETFEDVAQQFTDAYEVLFAKCDVCEGVREKLEESKAKGYQNVILSSCENRILHEQCDALGITKYFTDIFGIDNVLGGSKIGVGKKWMAENNISADDCIFVGDTSADYDTAQSLGIQNVILVSSGHQSYARLADLHHTVVKSVREIEL